jgi:hypothetical protein
MVLIYCQLPSDFKEKPMLSRIATETRVYSIRLPAFNKADIGSQDGKEKAGDKKLGKIEFSTNFVSSFEEGQQFLRYYYRSYRTDATEVGVIGVGENPVEALRKKDEMRKKSAERQQDAVFKDINEEGKKAKIDEHMDVITLAEYENYFKIMQQRLKDADEKKEYNFGPDSTFDPNFPFDQVIIKESDY